MDVDTMLIETADKLDCNLTVLSYLADGLDESAVAILCGNVSTLFKKNQLGSTPNLSYIFNAP